MKRRDCCLTGSGNEAAVKPRYGPDIEQDSSSETQAAAAVEQHGRGAEAQTRTNWVRAKKRKASNEKRTDLMRK